MAYRKTLRILLIVLVGFLAVTAIAGGLGLLSGAIAPGTGLLADSPFTDYTIPGLALLFLVGGSALAATVLLLRHHRLAFAAAALSGAMILAFEVVEVLVIGSDPGVARSLQLFYGLWGLLILVVAATAWWLDRRDEVGGAA